jgi:putative LysE/RhtB family amino acid efflux pump
LIGGTLMILVGIYELVTSPEGPEPRRRPRSKSNLGRYTSTFLLTITNPITILSFGAVFAVAGAVAPDGDLFAAWTLVAGVLCGSLLWFSALCGFSRLFRHRIDAEGMRVISRASGVLVIVFGVIVLLTLTGFSERILKHQGQMRR